MAKILEVNPQTVSIGLDNGSITEVASDTLNFVPHVGDEVEVFQTENKTIVSKKAAPAPTAADIAGGININVTNANNASNATNVNAAAQPTYVVMGKPVNKTVYLLLNFFLGGIGAHKFYAGKTGAGIMYLIFCWTYIPGCISVIDFIIGLTKKADANGNIFF